MAFCEDNLSSAFVATGKRFMVFFTTFLSTVVP